MIRLILLLSLSSCAGLPPNPTGELCSLSTKEQVADCVSLEDTLDGKPSMAIVQPLSGMENWVLMSPETFAHIQAYIVQLRSRYLSK